MVNSQWYVQAQTGLSNEGKTIQENLGLVCMCLHCVFEWSKLSVPKQSFMLSCYIATYFWPKPVSTITT